MTKTDKKTDKKKDRQKQIKTRCSRAAADSVAAAASAAAQRQHHEQQQERHDLYSWQSIFEEEKNQRHNFLRVPAQVKINLHCAQVVLSNLIGVVEKANS